jgi:hypothetical protein
MLIKTNEINYYMFGAISKQQHFIYAFGKSSARPAHF